MRIDKSYFTLPEILERWQITETDLIYLAENDKLRLSVRVFGVPMEFGDIEDDARGEPFRVPWEQSYFSGLLDLHARDVFQLFRCGQIHLESFRAPNAGYAQTWGDAQPILVMIGDLLLRRDERDRFEIETRFASGGQPLEEPTFIHSADYLEVWCKGCRFKLGPIQAEVVRALHTATQTGSPWQNGKAILSRAGSKSLRMADVFKSQKDWRNLIRSDLRGGYRLNLD